MSVCPQQENDNVAPECRAVGQRGERPYCTSRARCPHAVVQFMRISLLKGGSVFAIDWTALDRTNPAVWYLLFIGVALGSYALSFRYGIDLDDEGLLIGGAADVLGGRYPLADFYSYQPWMYFSLAGFFRLFGTTLLVERLYLIVNLL